MSVEAATVSKSIWTQLWDSDTYLSGIYQPGEQQNCSDAPWPKTMKDPPRLKHLLKGGKFLVTLITLLIAQQKALGGYRLLDLQP